MFNWFQPHCPCNDYEKDWIEERLHWLYDQFPENVYNGRRMILPLRQFFPDTYDQSYESVRTMLAQTCEYMDVDPALLDMEIIDEVRENFSLVNNRGHAMPQAAGTFSIEDGRFLIRIERAGLHDPMSLVGTMAHELAHVRLLGEERCDGEAYDNELLTDLTVVFLGLGIFLANSPRYFHPLNSHWPDTNVRRPEYMTPQMFGWALAHVAWHDQQRWPPWAPHLKMGSRGDLKQSLKYLWLTEDSGFRP